MKKILVVVAAMFALALTACGGPDCKSLCDESNKCDGATADTLAACKTSCDQADKLNSASGCTSKYDDLLSCADDNKSKICDANNDSCSTETAAYVACVLDFCTANPTNAACQ
jgi:hypothetical protein